MGTRSLTTIIQVGQEEDGKKWSDKIVTIYRQMDGYPEGMGVDLAEFLVGGKLVNGIGFNETELIFNGAGCLAAQIVAHFKDGPGGYYLYRGGTKNCWEQYRYEVIIDEGKDSIILKVIEIGYENAKGKYINKPRTIFTGTAKEFLESELVNS